MAIKMRGIRCILYDNSHGLRVLLKIHIIHIISNYTLKYFRIFAKYN